MMYFKHYKCRLSNLFFFVAIVVFPGSCKKLIQIKPPVNSITTVQVYADSADAAAAVSGIYSSLNMSGSSAPFGNGAITIACGIYGDELAPYSGVNSTVADEGSLYSNILSAIGLSSNLWDDPYRSVYQANACIEGLEASTTLSVAAKNQFLGESKFLRALIYFYLLNLYGELPYVGSTDFTSAAKSPRASAAEVYQHITDDLTAAETLLLADYSYSNGERIRANQWAARALLARVYLYNSQWTDAERAAGPIIENVSMFGINMVLNDVFIKNNQEGILQWNTNSQGGIGNMTFEGFKMIPFPAVNPNYYLSDQLLNDFEIGDLRRLQWIDSADYLGTNYKYPHKYKVGPLQYSPGGPTTEYYMVLRIAEQYLIRAEARAHQNNLVGSIEDINVIRNRAGLPDLSSTLTQAEVLSAIEQERRIEFFAEWGHRWFDLKRTGRADDVMSIVSPLKNGGIPWEPFRKNWPFPLREIQRNPFLIQNGGY